jgi:8-oxo-dGTP diphosphatase
MTCPAWGHHSPRSSAEREPTIPPATGSAVGAALIVDGRLLAARRRYPPALAGRWEQPGGKVELGEDARSALARELREELAINATIGPLLARTPITPTTELAVYLCTDFAGVPTLGQDHDALDRVCLRRHSH